MTHTEMLLNELEGIAFGMEATNKITPQIISLIIQLRGLHGKTMFFIQETGGLKLAIDTCSKLKEMGVSDRACFSQITTSNSRKKAYPVDVAMEAISHVYGE